MKDLHEEIAAQPMLHQAFREAFQLRLPGGDFAQLTRNDEPEIGRGLTCNIADYQSGGRFA